MDHILYGKKSEALAVSYLKRAGYKILETNYKNVLGEIDIIATGKTRDEEKYTQKNSLKNSVFINSDSLQNTSTDKIIYVNETKKDKGKFIIFVEVKARMSSAFGDPAEAVDIRKQSKIRQVATMYLKSNKMLDTSVRFDVIAVLGDEITDIRHIKDAF